MSIIDFMSLDIRDKRVLIREDLNVPVADGRVTSDARIRAAIPTIRHSVDQGAVTLVMSHLGRPTEGVPISEQPESSLAPVAARLETLSGLKVALVSDYLDGFEMPSADVVLFENIRVNPGESDNSAELSARLAALCDIFVMDAFATAHRAQASTEGVARLAPVASAGPLLMAELDALGRVMAEPLRPLVAVVGGSKVSTKLQVLDSLSARVDQLIVGGGIANTFLAAAGLDVGRSLYEPDLIPDARELAKKVTIPLPTDVVVATRVSGAPSRTCPVTEVRADEMILDIGPDSRAALLPIIEKAGTVLWNGPVGVFEQAAFAEGTRVLANAIASSTAFSVAGGGDTLAAIDQFGVADSISYVSTGGGAFLEFVEGKTLPAVAALEARAHNSSA